MTGRLTPADRAPRTAHAAGVQERCRELARRWRVTVTESFETESSLIAYGVRDAEPPEPAEPVVLKVVKTDCDEWRSGEVVRAFGGRGMVRALEQAQGAALFERIVPGTELVELSRRGRDDDATEVLADLIASMSPDPAPPWCPTVSELGRGFAWYLDSSDTQIPPALVHRGSETYTQLSETQRATRLLHGDLQHYNVLRDERRGWLAIDPKGVVGEVEYEVGASLRNPGELPDLLAEPATIERRISRMASRLGLDADRVLFWAYAEAVLSAIWLVQDRHVVGPGSPPLRLAHTLEKMFLGA